MHGTADDQVTGVKANVTQEVFGGHGFAEVLDRRRIQLMLSLIHI